MKMNYLGIDNAFKVSLTAIFNVNKTDCLDN